MLQRTILPPSMPICSRERTTGRSATGPRYFRRPAQPIELELEAPQDPLFLLRRLRQRGIGQDTLDALARDQVRCTWPAHTLDGIARRLHDVLAHSPAVLVIHTPQQMALVVEAIEGNHYFAAMNLRDPRLDPLAIARAQRLRQRAAAALMVRIDPVPLPAGMSTGSVVAH